MKRVSLLAALLTFALAGCAQFYLLFGKASNETPVVVVAGGMVKAVEPDPLRFKRGNTDVTITWQLDSAYRFAANGIVIDGETTRDPKGKPEPRQAEIVNCERQSNTRFTCLNRNTRPGTYKYTVRIETADGKPLPPLDPSIFNMP